MPTLIEKIGKIYGQYDHTRPFEYTFLDDDFANRYRDEENLGTLLNVFTGLTVLIAIIVAAPIAWYCMYKWLEGFAYRIPVGWTAFVVAGAGAMGIALATVSWEALRAAMVNPVKNLTSE